MFANELLERATEFVATCQRHLSRAARRVRSVAPGRNLDSRFLSGRYSVPYVANGIRRFSGCSVRNGFSRHSMKRMIQEEDEEERGEDGVWKRTILMGEKCQPLEFSGVICYDSRGMRVAAPPRSPFRTLLLSADENEKGDD